MRAGSAVRGQVVRAAAVRTAVLAGVWWAVAEGSATGWGMGLVAVGLAVAASLWLQPPGGPAPRLQAVPGFALWFVRRAASGSVDVARRALRRRVDLDPAVLVVPVRLPDGWPTVLLADVLSLLPGTLAVHRRGDALEVHVLDARRPVRADVAELERRVAGLFGLPPPGP